MKKGNDDDPKGLIFEAYRIEGVTLAECRSIFLDWALSLPTQKDTGKSLRALLDIYHDDNPDHPMTGVLEEGLVGIATPRRRGGWRSRPRS